MSNFIKLAFSPILVRDSCITYRKDKLPNCGDFDLEQNVCFWRDNPQWTKASSFTRFLDHIQRCTTVGRTPLDERSAQSKDLYLTTHTQYSQQSNAHAPGGIRTHNLSRRTAADVRSKDHAAAVTGSNRMYGHLIYLLNGMN